MIHSHTNANPSSIYFPSLSSFNSLSASSFVGTYLRAFPPLLHGAVAPRPSQILPVLPEGYQLVPSPSLACPHCSSPVFCFFLWITLGLLTLYLLNFFISERREGRETDGETNIDVWEKHQLVASCTCPNWGPGPHQLRHVSWPEIRPATFRCVGQCPTHWASPVQAGLLNLDPMPKRWVETFRDTKPPKECKEV